MAPPVSDLSKFSKDEMSFPSAKGLPVTIKTYNDPNRLAYIKLLISSTQLYEKSNSCKC